MSFQGILASIKQSPCYSGLVGSSASAVLAALRDDYRSILVIAANSEKAEALKSEIELFSGKEVHLFPALDTIPGEDIQPSKELVGERLAILEKWGRQEDLVVVAPVKAVVHMTSRRLEGLRISGNQAIRLDDLINKLIEFGYKRFDIVGERGEFSIRGGIIDIFPLNLDQPVRIELMDDRIESLRSFDSFSQRSIDTITEISVMPAQEFAEVPVFDHLSNNTLVVWHEKMELNRELGFEELPKLAEKKKQITLSAFLASGEETSFVAPLNYVGKVEEIPQDALIISKHAARLRDEIDNEIIEGSLRGGFVIANSQILSDREIFGEETVFRKAKPLSKEGVADELLADLKIGDYVVHENYGIGLYRGMSSLEIDGIKQEYLLIGFADEDKVYVPPSMAGLVEKYSSGADFKPKLSRLSSKQWLRTKGRVKNRLRNITKELLELYAAREKLSGFAFPADNVWQVELEGTFPYTETPDQGKAIVETKQDMEQSRPMDRLVCGDVGYGKTEVAIRAAAKAVSAGKQVAVLVPTTILAEQHYNNFRERLKSFPVVVEMLSRFKSKADQIKIVKAAAVGGVDIVIGTHRLLQKDIKFMDLGLVIVDEEQRFGVAHKEKLKQAKQSVDVLTLSATPIPRTLYLSLSGARDISTIHTPPIDRSPIRTYVIPWNEAVIREAVLREIDRRGQIYFLHNFVETIDGVASRIKKIVPEARVGMAHGQMSGKVLEKTMIEFLDRKFDLLACTSIIESGLDITNVNTILIDQADRFGLSQLYQIRGRVGRSAARAYAYLFYHPQKVMTDQALERLKAIQEFTALGSGYKLAMRDLEIRGAGNLLGAEQSGHVVEVGFDLYCELLEEAVREVKGIKEATPREVTVDLKIEAYIPEAYIPDDRQRIAVYRRLNLLAEKKGVDEMKKELEDRFGGIPDKLAKLFDVLYLKVKALKAGIRSIKEQDGQIIVEKLTGQVKRVEIKGGNKLKFVTQYIGG